MPRPCRDAWNYGEDPERYPFDTGRLRGVIEKAASEAGWGRKLPKGRGLGIAAHRSFVSYAAVVVEVAVGDQGRAHHPARRHRVRLRRRGQSRPRPLADRRRGRAGHQPGDAGRDQLQERARRADQLRRLRGHAHRRRADGDPHAPRQHDRRSTSRWAASANPACRRSRRRWPTRSSPPPASASAACRSATSSRGRRSGEVPVSPPTGAERSGRDDGSCGLGVRVRRPCTEPSPAWHRCL